ncbi:hypothetical protein [Streptomyces sp. NPDC017529]|uniref:hypothetical protein n=1 Tax=Streptomyces sp. NPDC017529 TaxID=3365000 RepID=UPI0037AF2482
MNWHAFFARSGISPARLVAGAAFGGLWWWAVLRLTLWPGTPGIVEGAVAAGGWGLSLLPVHCVPRAERGRAGGRHRDGGALGRVLGRAEDVLRDGVTRAWRRRRWGGGSGRS